MSQWFLECYVKSNKNRQRVRLNQFPFTVGRQDDLPLAIHSPEVSRFHAEFVEADAKLILRDLGSTNGTFVNHKQVVNPCSLQHGDIVHFGNIEYRLLCEEPTEDTSSDATIIGISELSRKMPAGLPHLQELLANSMTTAVFEPIIFSNDGSLFGYEMLGRGRHPKLPQSPKKLFQIAESADLEVELSEIFRQRGLELSGRDTLMGLPLLVNTHPRELENPARLLDSISILRQQHPETNLFLEIHEEAVTDLQTMRELKRQLQQLNIKLAYDDFGAGQARLIELVESPPDILKFDMSLVQGIGEAPPARRHMVETLIQLSKDSQITTLAEGISSAQDADACQALGFDLMQGYLFQGPSYFFP